MKAASAWPMVRRPDEKCCCRHGQDDYLQQIGKLGIDHERMDDKFDGSMTATSANVGRVLPGSGDAPHESERNSAVESRLLIRFMDPS